MGAVRIRNEFYTDQAVRYRVDIWDNDWAGATTTTYEDNGFEIQYDNPDKFLSPLIPSSCFYTIYDDGSSVFNTFKSDLANAIENEFKLVIYKYTGGVWVIYWAGIIMSDMVGWDNDVAPRQFEIIAKCGLNRLEGITFDKILSTPYTTDPIQTLIKIIFDCLSYAGTAQFWNGASKPYITTVMGWHDTQQTSVTQNKIFSFIAVGRETLIDNPAKSEDNQVMKFRGINDPPLKAKEILTNLLQLFACRIILSDGSWQIQQVSMQANNTNTQGEYNYLGAYTGNSSAQVKQTENGGTLALLGGGKFGYYPPVRIAKAKIYPSDILNGSFYINTEVYKDNLTFTSSTFALGTLYGGTSLQLQLNIMYDVRAWNPSVCKDFYIEVKAKLVMGSQRILHSETTVGYRGGDVQWTTTAANEYIFDINFFSQQSTIINKSFIIPILTPDIPAGTYDNSTLVITATLKSLAGLTNWPAKSLLNVWFNRASISLIDTSISPPVYGQITGLEILGSNSAENSIEIDYGLIKITDNLARTPIASFNSVMVTVPNDAGSLLGSEVWEAGFAADEDLVTTLLKETLALQKTSIQKYTGSYRSSTYNAWNTILYDAIVWVFMGGRYTAKTDTWDCEWFGIAWDSSGMGAATNRVNDGVGGTVYGMPQWKYPKDYTKLLPLGPTPTATKNTKDAQGATVTSIAIDTSLYSHIRAGDIIYLINPNTGDNLQSFTVTADVEIGATSISVTSDTADVDLWQSIVIAHEPRSITVSNELRGVEIITLGNSGSNYSFEKVLKVLTTNATVTEATTDGALASASNIILVPDDSSLSCIITVSAKESNTADCLMFVRQALFVNNSGTTALEGAVQTIGTDINSVGFAGTAVTITANNGNDAIKVEVTGLALTSINWTINVKCNVCKYS